ncbi:MAG: hypothetical protein U0Y82_12250 [Thermoleophilia bacterium]
MRDVQGFAQTLTAFAQSLRRASAGPGALRATHATLVRELATLRAFTDRMAGYHATSPALEQRRAAVVAAAPRVTQLGAQLVQNALDSDAGKASPTATEFLAALKRLQTAAGG